MNKLIIILSLAVTIKLIDCHRAIQPPVPGLPENTDRTTTNLTPKTTTTPEPKGPFLLDNYLAPSMQALAYYIEMLQYEPAELTTLEPPFNGWEAEGGTTYKPPLTSRRPSTTTKSSTVWWKPPSTHSTIWWVPPTTTPRTTTTKKTTYATTTTTTKKPIATTSYPTKPWWQTTTTSIPQRTTTTIKPVTWWQPPSWWTSTTTKKPIITTTTKPPTTTKTPTTAPPTSTHKPGLYAPLPPFYSRPEIPPIKDNSLYHKETTTHKWQTNNRPAVTTTQKWQSNNRPSGTTTQKWQKETTTQKWQTNSRPAGTTTQKWQKETTTQKWQTNNRPAGTTTQKWQKETTTQKWQTNNRPAKTTTQKWQSNNRPDRTTTTPFTSITSDKNFYSWFFQQKAKVFKPEFEYDFNLLDPLPGALIHDIIYERSELPAISDKDNVNDFLRVYDDNFGRIHSHTGKKRIPITKPYVEFLMLYDLLKRDAKAMNLSKYEGYTENMLHELAELSTRSAERQLHALLTRMLLRNDVERTDVVNRVKGIIKDLENPDTITAKAMRYFHPLPFVL